MVADEKRVGDSKHWYIAEGNCPMLVHFPGLNSTVKITIREEFYSLINPGPNLTLNLAWVYSW